jgi:tellurite resistance protein TerC
MGAMPPLAWAALVAAVAVLLVIDLRFAHRDPERVPFREAAAWSVGWMAAGLAFGLVVMAALGGEAAGSYWAGFLTEKALSLDNVFVIAVLLGSFAVPVAQRGRVLSFGIAGALALRTVFIVAGVALLELFHPVLYVFGALLLVTGVRLAIKDEEPASAADSRPLRALRRALPGASPFVAALMAVAVADVVFAIDSVPAVLAITTDTFIVFAANAFALLGLRALYFLLDGMADRFAYLHYGLAALLVFIGAKMLLSDVVHLSPAITLPVIVATLGASIGASLWTSREARAGARA